LKKPVSAALAAAVLIPLVLAPTASAVALPGKAASVSPAAVAKDPEPGFRVLPYLQAPASDSMTINWISETDEPGTATITGPGVGKSGTLSSEPMYLDLMEYTQAELDQQIEGLDVMSRDVVLAPARNDTVPIQEVSVQTACH
jgi:hypothetical protein